MAEYCCEVPLNPFWRYCPHCGKATSAKHRDDIYVADQRIEMRRRRKE